MAASVPPKVAPAAAEQVELPLREIPGSYGRIPWLKSIKDRLDFFWLEGETQFWEKRRRAYKSTVFRTHVPPSPPAFRPNPVVMLLDQRSFPILFDTDKVYKKDVLTANFMPSLAYFGGYRPCVYLDPAEERHRAHKEFIMAAIKSAAGRWIPEAQKATESALDAWEAALAKSSPGGGSGSGNGKGVGMAAEAAQMALRTLVQSLLQLDPIANGLSPLSYQLWLGPQVLPIAASGLPRVVDAVLLHAIRVPFLAVAFFYSRVVGFYRRFGGALLDLAAAPEFGIARDDALHAVAFFVGFNAFGGLSILLPWLATCVGQLGEAEQAAMAAEVRAAVEAEEGGRLTMAAVRRMPLVRSAVYETLRMHPPVPYQYAVAKHDVEIESHEARFAVRKGEMLGGCLAAASRDPVVFGPDADRFVAGRFVGPAGEALVARVLWANGPADAAPAASNKLCPGVSLVPLIAHVFLATFFLRFDAFASLAPPADPRSSFAHSLLSVKRRRRPE